MGTATTKGSYHSNVGRHSSGAPGAEGEAASSWKVYVEVDGCACPTASTAHPPAAEVGMQHEGTCGPRDTDSFVSGARGEISAFVAKEKG